MNKIRRILKNILNKRTLILLFSILLIVASFVFLIIYIVNYDGADRFKDVSLILATIAVGIIPISLQIKEKIDKDKKQEFIEHNNAVEDVEKIRLLDTDAKHLFIRRTLESFYSNYGLNKLCESFISFKNNSSFYESINGVISSTSGNMWMVLVKSINECKYFLPDDSQIKNSDIDDNDRLDLFLAMMVNEMEMIDVLCYRYLTMRVEKEMFDKFERKPILKMYSYCYYLLVELRINERFKQIDSVCAIIKSEEEDTKK